MSYNKIICNLKPSELKTLHYGMAKMEACTIKLSAAEVQKLYSDPEVGSTTCGLGLTKRQCAILDDCLERNQACNLSFTSTQLRNMRAYPENKFQLAEQKRLIDRAVKPSGIIESESVSESQPDNA